MRVIELTEVECNEKELLKKTALEADTAQVISEPGVFTFQGKVVAIYGRLQDRYSEMQWAVQSLPYPETTRTGGLKTRSRIFGFSPRVALRKDFCSTTAMATEAPMQHEIICGFGVLLNNIYKEFAPEIYKEHQEKIKCVSEDWVINGTVFTSGIVNKTNSLNYHYDSGNFKDVMSCMVVFRKDCTGGFLSIPRFGIRFLLEDHSFFLFDGQSILHGVTPIKTLTSKSYRYSVVYYSLNQMKNCGSCLEEARRIRKLKRTREKKRVTNE